MSERPLHRQPTPLEQLENVIDSLLNDELVEGIKMEAEEPSEQTTQHVRAIIRSALGDDASSLPQLQPSTADSKVSTLKKFSDFLMNLAYEGFPDDASFIGDGAIRALAIGGARFVSPAGAYGMDVAGSLAIIAAVVAIAKHTYEIISQHQELTEAEIIARVAPALKEQSPPLPRAIDDKALQFIILRTIEFTKRNS
jgi:hypothetical protein